MDAQQPAESSCSYCLEVEEIAFDSRCVRVCVCVCECWNVLGGWRLRRDAHVQPSWPLSCTPPVERGQLEAWRSVQQHCWQLSTQPGWVQAAGAQFQSEVAGFGLLSLQRVFVAQGSTEAGRLLVAHCI